MKDAIEQAWLDLYVYGAGAVKASSDGSMKHVPFEELMNMDLPPGRELDALIAEKVMGKSLYKKDGWGELLDGLDEPVAHYSTSIAAAWEVVERMRERGCPFEMRTPPNGYWVYFGEETSTEAPTAPHAICLAALKATQSS